MGVAVAACEAAAFRARERSKAARAPLPLAEMALGTRDWHIERGRRGESRLRDGGPGMTMCGHCSRRVFGVAWGLVEVYGRAEQSG